MNKSKNLIRRLSHWYRNLFIEFPEDYGDPMSPKVEEFQNELNEKKDATTGFEDQQEMKQKRGKSTPVSH